jgi:hypothetical protein
VPNQAATARARAPQPELVARLAKFFPHAVPVRIAVDLSRVEDSPKSRTEAGERETKFLEPAVIEFATPQEVLFAVDHPLEFADRLVLETKDGALRAEASVVAVQYHAARTVIAARFVNDVPNWIVKL